MAELPGPFNAAVREFREITRQNAERTAALEKRRETKENLADEKLISNLKTLEDKLSKAEGDDRKLLEAQIEQNREEQAERAERKTKDDELKVLSYKTLGISEKRFEKAEELRKEAEQSRSQLNELKTQLEKNGVDVKNNANFQRLEAKVRRKERAAQLKAMPAASALKERAKDSATYLKGLLGKFLGPQSRIGGLLGSIAGNLKSKVTGTISTLLGVLKTGAFIAGLAALLFFLNSPTWEELKEKLIPRLQTAIENTKAAIGRIYDAFFGKGEEDGSFVKGIRQIITEIFGSNGRVMRGFESLKRIFEAFFGRGGVGPKGLGARSGSFVGGMTQILYEVFGENSAITKGVMSLSAALKEIFFAFFGDPNDPSKPYGIFTGLYEIYNQIFNRAKNETDEANKELSNFEKLGLAVEIAAMLTLFRGVLGVIRLANKGLRGMAGVSTASNIGRVTAGGAGLKTGQIVQGKGQFAGKRFKVNEFGRLLEIDEVGKFKSGPIPKGMTQANILQNIEAPKGSFLGKVGKSGLRFLGGLDNVLRRFPLIGQALAIGDLATIMMSDAPASEKLTGVTGIIGGLGGSALGALLGGIVGGFFLPIVGNLIGSLGGGILGYFQGEQIARGLAQYALGMTVDAFPTLPSFFGMKLDLNKILNGSGKVEPSMESPVQGGAVPSAPISSYSYDMYGAMTGASQGTGGAGTVLSPLASELPVITDQAILQQISAARSFMKTASGDIDDLGTAPTVVNFQGGSTTNITENKNVQYSATDVNATIYAHLQGMIP